MGVPLNFINVGVWNIHGLFVKINNFKLNKLDDSEFLKRLKQFEILCLQEIHCGQSDTQSLSVKGYKLFPFHRQISNNNRYYGGSLLFVKDEIRDGVKIIQTLGGDKIWIRLKKEFFNLERDIFLCFVYAPPESSTYAKNLDYDILEKLELEISTHSSMGNIIIAGDFNAKTGTECDYVSDIDDQHSPVNGNPLYPFDKPIRRNNRDKHGVDMQGQRLLNLCKNTQIRLLNGRTQGDRMGEFTRFPLSLRESPSTIDYIAVDTSIMNKIKTFSILHHMGLSDHDCLMASINTQGFNIPAIDHTTVIKEKVFKHATSEEFLCKIRSPVGQEKIKAFFNQYSQANATVLENMSGDLVDTLLPFTKGFASGEKRKKTRKRKQEKSKIPWYSSECRKLKCALNRAVKDFKRNTFCRATREKMFSLKKRFKNKCKESERKCRNKLLAKLLSIEEHKPTEFWNLVKKIKNWGKSQIKPENNIDPKDWLNHFQDLLNEGEDPPDHFKEDLHKLESEPTFSELDYRISVDELDKSMKRLNKKSAPGPDKISGNLLFVGKGDLQQILLLFLNKLFSHAFQPHSHSLNFLLPIFKKGEIWMPDNYRGIAIGSALAKIFEIILLGRLEEKIYEKHPISINQIGFKKGHRTSDHIFVLKTIIDKIVKNNKKKLFVAFIDFRKAYDRVNRTLLFLKLQKIGIKGLFYRNIKNLSSNVSYLVKCHGGFLEEIFSKYGLKQGGVISALLFNLYIDDLKDIFDDTCDPIHLFNKPLSHLLYADDLALISTTQCGLNKCLEKLHTFTKTWQLELNISKCKVIVFNCYGKILKGMKFIFNNLQLEIVKSYCYLGLDFISSGSFRTARSNLVEKAHKALAPISSLVAQFNIPSDKALYLFNTMIRPIVMYNSENLSHLTEHQINTMYENKNSLLFYANNTYPNRLQQKFLKFILGVKRNCTNLGTLGELGETPIILHGFTALLSFWHRTYFMPENTLVKQALNLMMNDTQAKYEWLATVKFLLHYLDMDAYFLNPQLTNSTTGFTSTVKKKLRSNYIKEWFDKLTDQNTRIGASNKLRFYKLFKTSFHKEPYLNHIKDFKLRKTLTKFRCSDHILEIKVGRQKNLMFEERICKLCNSGEVETELHFLGQCPAYTQLRSHYFGDAMNWIDILICKDKITNYKLANYIDKAFKFRKNVLASL